MKPKHRHDLKTNELAEWLGNLPRWAEENLTSIIIFCVLGAGLVGGFIYYRYMNTVVKVRQQQRITNLITRLPTLQTQIIQASTQGRDRSFELINLAKKLSNLANRTGNNTTAAIALIRSGDAYRAELHYRPEIIRKADLRKQINQAKQLYQQALEILGSPLNDPNGPTSTGKQNQTALSAKLPAMAKFKIALCEEELGNFAKAEEIYRNIIGADDLKFTPTYSQARERVAIISELKQKITFAPPQKTTPAGPGELPGSNIFQDINTTGANAPLIETSPSNEPVSANLCPIPPVEIKTETSKPPPEAVVERPNSDSNQP